MFRTLMFLRIKRYITQVKYSFPIQKIEKFTFAKIICASKTKFHNYDLIRQKEEPPDVHALHLFLLLLPAFRQNCNPQKLMLPGLRKSYSLLIKVLIMNFRVYTAHQRLWLENIRKCFANSRLLKTFQISNSKKIWEFFASILKRKTKRKQIWFFQSKQVRWITWIQLFEAVWLNKKLVSYSLRMKIKLSTL